MRLFNNQVQNRNQIPQLNHGALLSKLQSTSCMSQFSTSLVPTTSMAPNLLFPSMALGLNQMVPPMAFPFDVPTGSNTLTPNSPLSTAAISAISRQLISETLGGVALNTKGFVQSPVQHTLYTMETPVNKITHSITQKRERKKRICSYTGCRTLARLGGFCIRHGGGKRCIAKGCVNLARYKGSVCKIHKDMSEKGIEFKCKSDAEIFKYVGKSTSNIKKYNRINYNLEETGARKRKLEEECETPSKRAIL